MKKRILYQSYRGSEPYIFLLYDRADRQKASETINAMIDRQFRLCYYENNPQKVPDHEEMATHILGAHLVLFLISQKALLSLAFRNSVNYALSKNKKIFCIYLDDQKMQYGLDIQLANIPGVRAQPYPDTDTLCGDIIKNDLFVQDMRGEGARAPLPQTRKKRAAIAAIIAVFVVFAVSATAIAAYRVQYTDSLAGQIEQMTGADYLDISDQDASLAGLLAGKSVQTLRARNMGLESAEAFSSLDCEDLDLSNNPGIPTLEPLLENSFLKTLRVSQDMLGALSRIRGRHSFNVIITE